MGQEITCAATFDGTPDEGRAHLESSELTFRGATRRTIPLASVRDVEVADGTLTLHHAAGTATFALGPHAARWAERIRSPKSVIDKLGVKAGQRVSVVGVTDTDFLARLRERVGDIGEGRPSPASDAIFFGAESEKALARIATLARSLAPAGALWVVRPKGKGGVSEAAVRAAGLSAGLVDVKVVAFSATHTAEKFVIPVAKRR